MEPHGTKRTKYTMRVDTVEKKDETLQETEQRELLLPAVIEEKKNRDLWTTLKTIRQKFVRQKPIPEEYQIPEFTSPLVRVEASPEQGLTKEQVEDRIARGAVNHAVESASKSKKEIICSNIFTYFNLIFFIIAVLLIVVGSFRDLTFLPVIIANTAIGIFQELRSKKVLDELTILNAPKNTVLRDGRIVEANKPLDSRVTNKDIVELMLGRAYNAELDRSGRTIGEVVLETKGLCEGNGRVKDISITLRKGEIVGLSGLVGAGKTELCKTLYGAYPKSAGQMTVNGKAVNFRSPREAVRAGMALIPEERRKEGIIVGESVCSNLSMATLSKHTGFLTFVNTASELKAAKEKILQVKVKTPSPYQQIQFLSGGNQQKVTIGKWLDSDADIYIFDEPTKGIDVGAKQDVYNLIIDLARQGKAILYSSSEQSEILQLTDRAYIMYGGRIQKEVNTAQATEELLLLYSTGGKEE